MTTITKSQTSLLFNALLANAIFSSICGGVMSLAPGTVVNWLDGARVADIQSLGFGLLLFAGWLIFISLRRSIKTLEAWAIVIGDFVWVLSSMLLLATQSHQFSTLGIILIADVAVIVLVFALFQAKGIRQSS